MGFVNHDRPESPMRTVLCADVGATKTLVGLAQGTPAGPINLLMTRRYAAADYASLPDVLSAFAADWQQQHASPMRVHAACLGVAGPVAGEPGHEHVQMTNLPWRITAAELSAHLQPWRAAAAPTALNVRIVNDFVAAAHGVDALHAADLLCLQAGQPIAGAPQLVLGAGSGLGVAWRIWQERHYTVWPSESGHAGFASPGPEFDALMPALRQRFGRVVNEHLVSGPGLVTLDELLRHSELASAPGGISGNRTGRRGEDIVRLAQLERDPVALRVLDLFLLAYGAVAGDLALGLLARGGVYLSGGIAAQCGALMQDGRFIAAFTNQGSYAELAASLPVWVMTQANVPLLGAAKLGLS